MRSGAATSRILSSLVRGVSNSMSLRGLPWQNRTGPRSAISPVDAADQVLIVARPCRPLRAAQGVLRLGDKYSPDRLEAACGKALRVGDPTYRTVKGILVAGVEADPLPPTAGDGGAAAFLHCPRQLFGNVVCLDPPSEGDCGENDEHDQTGAGVLARSWNPP
jgi:hypothetical protein